jgi:hypothetical protein
MIESISMSTTSEVKEFVVDFRSDIENCWDEATANTKWRHWSPSEHTAASHGQCGPTALLLHELLADTFPNEVFSIAAGRVRLLGARGLRMALETHLWVDRQSLKYEETEVLDATADQAQGIILPPQVTASYDELEDQGIMYIPRRHFDTPDALYRTYNNAEARNRTAILRERYHALKLH